MAILIYHGKTAHKNSLFIYSRYHDARLAQIFLACCAVAARDYKEFISVSLTLFYLHLIIAGRTLLLLLDDTIQPFLLTHETLLCLNLQRYLLSLRALCLAR